ncbi:hypothetical protein [Kribbella sp. CA-247076]|uniref:hypothetical protein n=1 Tax=Kribbella sp. CA-247076 TaxID=3239941 RepID=UPI003D8A397D
MTDSVENQTGLAPPDRGLAEDERAELQRLRAELATYRQRDSSAKPGRARAGWRSVVAFLLILLGCLLVPLSVVGVWARNQVTDTDRYVATVTPLASDPGVQTALADRITAEIFTYVDVAGLTNQAVDVLARQGLPPLVSTQLRGLSGPLATAVRNFVRGKVGEVVASDTFKDTWVSANRIAHQEMVRALSGEGGGSVQVSEGTVSVDLGAFVAAAKQRLIDSGFTAAQRIPNVSPEFAVFSSRDLATAQTAYRYLESSATWLPVIAVVLIGLGVYVARRHRRALVGAGLGIAGSMLLLAVLLAIGRNLYLARIPEDVLSTTTAASVFDTLIRYLRTGLRMVLVLGLVVAVAAFFSGPSVTAVRTRHGVAAGIRRLREGGEKAGLRTGPVGTWVHDYLKVLRFGVIALASLVFIFLDRPTGRDVVVIAVLAVVVLAILEFLARPPQPAAHAPG